MKASPRIAAYLSILAIALISPTALAYGGGGSSSSSCVEPQYYEEVPARNSSPASLSEVSLVASANTDTSTLELQINGNKVTPTFTQRRSGEWQIQAKLPAPITQAGKVQITLTAKSKEGCWGFYPYYLEVKP